MLCCLSNALQSLQPLAGYHSHQTNCLFPSRTPKCGLAGPRPPSASMLLLPSVSGRHVSLHGKSVPGVGNISGPPRNSTAKADKPVMCWAGDNIVCVKVGLCDGVPFLTFFIGCNRLSGIMGWVPSGRCLLGFRVQHYRLCNKVC